MAGIDFVLTLQPSPRRPIQLKTAPAGSLWNLPAPFRLYNVEEAAPVA